MTNNKKHLGFGLAILAIALVVGGLIYQQESILRAGETVILATRPIDPRDLLRGEYVILRYEIETDELLKAAATDKPEGTSLFIKLSKDNRGVATVSEVSEQAPTAPGSTWIRGEIMNGQVRFPALEQFYVPEGAGTPIEDLRTDMHVEVALKDGEARVMRLLDASLTPIDPRSFLTE